MLCCTEAGKCRISDRAGHRLTFLTTPPSETVTSYAHTHTHTCTHVHTHTYLSQEQLTQKEITLSLTLKGQVDQSHTELSPSCPAFYSPHPLAPSHTALHAFVYVFSVFFARSITTVNTVFLFNFIFRFNKETFDDFFFKVYFSL